MQKSAILSNEHYVNINLTKTEDKTSVSDPDSGGQK
jgi:hypothetical protein